MEKKSLTTFVLALAFVLSAILVSGGTLAVAEESDSQATEAARDIPVSVAGMTVFVDEESGELRLPTAEEAAVLAEAIERMFGPAARSAEPFETQSFAGGAVGVDLGLSQLAFSVATVGADGAIDHECARTAEDALAHIHPQIAPREEK